MRLRNVKGSREAIAANKYVFTEPEKYKGRWQEIFEKKQPLYIEVGMGKGKFIMAQAKLHPEINFIGIEKYSSVLFRALEKMEEGQIKNLIFIRMDAEYIKEVFREGEVDRIYLNFSDPWPKDRHAKRRLTSRQFLEKYGSILKKDGHIIFKTDNRELFEFSIEEAGKTGWNILNSTFDLYNSPYIEGNVATEYEEKFAAKGNPICRMEIVKDMKGRTRN